MARKSRWSPKLGTDIGVASLTLPANSPEYSVAIYARLSVRDSGRGETDTMENQLRLLKDYVMQQPDLTLHDLYIDNGWTGTNFARPDFQRLLRDIYAGKINCVIVKDLSRLGRNHLETAYYLQEVFVKQHIRFISVNDGYDSLTSPPDSIEIMVKNIINDYYSKDISRKVSASLDLKRSQGVHSWGHAPYGYIRTAESPDRLQIDQETAAYVRLIFHWGMEEIPFTQIAARLTDLNAPTPKHLMLSRRKKNTHTGESDSWCISTVKQILLNQTYAGDFVYQKGYFRKFDAAHGHKIPEGEWLVIPDAHPAYIDREDFFMLKKRILALGRERSQQWEDTQHIREQYPALFQGMIYCRICGRHMSFRRCIRGSVYTAYSCRGKRKPHHAEHRSITINAVVLNEIVLTQINMQIQCAVDAKKLLAKISEENLDIMFKEKQHKQISILRKKMGEIKTSRTRAFEELAGGLIIEDEYRQRMDILAGEQLEITKQLSNAEAMCEMVDTHLSPENQWLRTFAEKGAVDELTTELVSCMIQRIDVLEDKRVHITFNYSDCMKAFMTGLEAIRNTDSGVS